MIIQVKREFPKASGAVRSRVFLDNNFFAYGLENKNYIFPDGKYSLLGKTSPSFKANKIYIDVPGRLNIMFHGGNGIEDTKGCILVAYNRDGERIQGDASSDLFKRVDSAYNAGEGVEVHISTPAKTALYWLGGAAILAGGFYIYKKTKKG